MACDHEWHTLLQAWAVGVGFNMEWFPYKPANQFSLINGYLVLTKKESRCHTSGPCTSILVDLLNPSHEGDGDGARAEVDTDGWADGGNITSFGLYHGFRICQQFRS